MKARLEQEKSAEKKTEWVNKMTDRVIEKDGKLRAVMGYHGPMGNGPKGPMGPGGFKGGPKGGFKGGPRGPVDTLPMPPAPQEAE